MIVFLENNETGQQQGKLAVPFLSTEKPKKICWFSLTFRQNIIEIILENGFHIPIELF